MSVTLHDQYLTVRNFSLKLCEPLEIEDYIIQAMPDASPIKWHLAHTTWFFEKLVLERIKPDYQPVNPIYMYLFNSYYNSLGPQWLRPQRGLLSRPTVQEIYQYRQIIDQYMLELLSQISQYCDPKLKFVILTGLHHEQQHQELILTDLQYAFSLNPLNPVYSKANLTDSSLADKSEWKYFDSCSALIGHDRENQIFAYDNETPRHPVLLQPFCIADKLVTNRQYMEFIVDDGYKRPELWLSDGWSTVQRGQWSAPLYWKKVDSQWHNFCLSGLKPVNPDAPICHVSYYEADAFAKWAKRRLPTEEEWEQYSSSQPIKGNFIESGYFQPIPPNHPKNTQIFGDVWEWTASPYTLYPGYTCPAGALGEYNSKFAVNQFVLRGGSCATSLTHIRHTYRNFWPPATRFQFSGIRLAQNL